MQKSKKDIKIVNMTDKEIRDQIVNIVLQATILIDTIDKLEERAEVVWLREIKQTGKSFREKLISYTTRQKHLYNDDTCEAFYQSLSVVEKFNKNLTIEKVQKIKETSRY